MKRIFWWTVFGVSGAGLPALWFGQSVFGQPDMKASAPLVITANGKSHSMDVTRSDDAPRRIELTGAQLPDVEPAPKVGPLPAPSSLTPPLPMATKVDPVTPPAPPATTARVERPVASSVPLDVQPGRQQPALSIEWTGPTTIRINQAVPYQIVVRNASQSTLHNVVIRHHLGEGVVCKSSDSNMTKGNGELIWSLGTLTPDQVRKIDLVLQSPNKGTLNCHATATFSAVAGHQISIREPKLAIKMTAPEKVVNGENVNLLIAVTNPGDGVAETIRAKIMMPEGLEHASGRKVIEFDVGNLAPKETRNMQLPCVAKGAGAQKCSIAATADGDLKSADAMQVEILVPKLEVALVGPKLRYLDRRAVYTVKVSNPGSAPASNVEVQELIPSGFRFQSASHAGQFQESSRLVTWNIGELQPNQTKEVTFDLVPIEPGDHRLMAHAKGRGLRSESEMRTLVEGLPSLAIEVSHLDDPIEVGAETMYEIRVANTGTKMETNLVVTCTLPEQLEFKAAKCTSTLKYRQEGRDLIFEPLSRLAPKADVIFRVQVRGIAPGDVRFQTKIRADGLKVPVLREESTRIYSDEAPARTTPTSTPAPKKTAAPSTPPLTPNSLPAPTPVEPKVNNSVPAPTPGPAAPQVSPQLPAPPLPAPAPSNLNPPAPRSLPELPDLPAPR